MRMGKLVLVELQIFVWIRSSLLYLPLSLFDLPCFFDFSPLGGVSCSVSDSDPDCDLLDLSVSDSDLFGLSFLDLLFLFPFLFGYGEWFLLFEDCPLCRDDELVLPFSLPLLLLLPLSFFLGQSLLRCPGC